LGGDIQERGKNKKQRRIEEKSNGSGAGTGKKTQQDQTTDEVGIIRTSKKKKNWEIRKMRGGGRPAGDLTSPFVIQQGEGGDWSGRVSPSQLKIGNIRRQGEKTRPVVRKKLKNSLSASTLCVGVSSSKERFFLVGYYCEGR